MKPTKEMKYDNLYMDLAVRIAQMSHDIDTKVGSLIVKDNNILAFGFNGTLAPCGECAKLIIQSGIARIVFDTDYKNDSGILLLMKQKQIKIDRVKRKDK